jgi:hypothetical protein
MAAAPRELPVAVRLGAFGVALLAAFAGAFGIGRAVGPVDAEAPAPTLVEHRSGHGDDHGHGG